MRQRRIEAVLIQMAIAIGIWVVLANWLFAGEVGTTVTLSGALAISLALAWWGIIRHGPPAVAAPRPAAPDARMLALSAVVAAAMCSAFVGDARTDDNALTWCLIFGGLAVVQAIRAHRARR